MTVSQSVRGYGLHSARARGGDGTRQKNAGVVRMQGEVIRYDKAGGVEVGDEPRIGYETQEAR